MSRITIIIALALAFAGIFAFGWSRAERVDAVAAARLERGRYLVEGPAHCFMCHSELDWAREGLPPRPGGEGGGQNPFPEEAFPWLIEPNISPDPATGTGAANSE